MGTISDKLTYLGETKSLLKEAINNLGGEIDNDTTFREYAEELDTIYSNLPKVTGEGTNLSLSPTLKGKLELEYKGDIYQETLTGKNLLNPEKASSTSGVLTTTYISDTRYRVQGLSSGNKVFFANMNIASGTYTISCTLVSGSYSGGNFVIQDTSNSTIGEFTIGALNTKVTKTVTGSIGRLILWNTQTFDVTLDIQIESGSTSTSYEKYVGGIPSPNPNYPQDIQVVTGEQEVVIANKNLLETNTISYNSSGTYNWTLAKTLEIGTYVLSGANISATSGQFVMYGVDEGGTQEAILSNKNWNGIASGYSFTTTKKYASLRIYTNVAVSGNIQLEFGTTPTSYEEHKSITYTLHLGDLELYEEGFISNEDDKWYINNEYLKFLLNGTEAWENYGGAYNSINAYRLRNENVDNSSSDMLCNYYQPVYITTFNSNNRTYGMCATLEKTTTSTANSIFMTAPDSEHNTLANFKTWLGSHNVEMLAKSKETIKTEITNTTLLSDLEYIRTHATSYLGTTNISSSGDLPIVISASALKGE